MMWSIVKRLVAQLALRDVTFQGGIATYRTRCTNLEVKSDNNYVLP